MLSTKIKKYREDNKITQTELADKLFVSRSAVAKWEQGKGIPNKESLEEVALLLNISIDELLDDETTYEVIDNLNTSTKKQSIYLLISCIILASLIIIIIIILFQFFYNTPIDVVTSPDGKVTFKVYNYVEDDYFTFKKNKGFHYEYYYEGEKMNSIVVKTDCEYVSINFSPSSRYYITTYYYYDDNNVKKLYNDLGDLQNGSGSNIQYYIAWELSKYYEIDEISSTDLYLNLISFADDADIVLFNYSFYKEKEIVNGYIWYDLFNRQSVGITDIPKVE